MTEPAIILIIDDNPDSLQVLNETLSAEHYTVLVATGGDAALSILQKTTPSLVLLDANMPGKDGFETCQLIKASWPHVPIIFMTGLGDTKDVVRGLDAGAVDYLVKPLNHTELLARVKVHINNARLTRRHWILPVSTWQLSDNTVTSSGPLIKPVLSLTISAAKKNSYSSAG